jgi:ethanolamine permease
MISLFFNADYRPGVFGTVLWFAAGLLYFALVGRNQLVYSPEEHFALVAAKGLVPDPEAFGDVGEPAPAGVDPVIASE